MNRRRTLAPGALGILLLGVLAYVVAGCSTRLIEGDGYRGVVFSPVAAEKALGSMLHGEDTASYWTPRAADIAALEDALVRHVALHDVGGLPLEEYRRQYYGFARDGARRVYVVGFCDEEAASIDWRREFVPLGAAGTCHFEAEYDVATARIVRYWTSE